MEKFSTYRRCALRLFTLNALIFIGIQTAFAQNYFSSTQEEFGKNRIQEKRFEWLTIRSNNFEFNYYRGGDKIAQSAAKLSESEYDRITELLGYTPFTTMKIFLYNSPKDLAQSNIGLTAPIDLDGSILNLAKSRVQIAYTGNEETFKKELIRQISRLFVYDMLYGGSLKEVLQSSLLLTVPEWYMAGISAYISENSEEPAVLDRLKVAVMKNKDKKISHLEGKDAELVGQSIWNYIAMRYGKDNISNILNLTRIIRTEESSITSTLGISYNRFMKEWKDFYLSGAYANTNEKLDEPKEKTIVSPKIELTKPKEKLVLEKGEVDTDNYEFDAENVIKSLANETARAKVDNTDKSIPKSGRYRETLKIKGPYAYENLMIANDMKFDFLMDPVRRMGVKLNLVLNDLLENHNIKLGLFVTPILKNHDVFLEYNNNAKRVDWGFGIMRRSISLGELDSRSLYLFRPLGITTPSTAIVPMDRRLYYNKFSVYANYPFSRNLRVGISPYLMTTTDIDLAELGRKTLSSNYLGYKAELVYDNTTPLFSKVLLGTRAKVRLERNYSLNSSTENFSRLVIDARHYQRVLNSFIFAARLSYSRSLGSAPKETFLGGVENSINRSVEQINGQGTGIPRDLRDILFYDYAGNLRGFNFAKLYGTSHLLTNFELRLPLAQYFSKGSLTSNFLRNMQFVGFSDIGTAWYGNKGPFNRQNSLNTEVIGGGANPFRATVTNFKNPFLIGYGMGVRTTILGYLVKADYAWGLEDKEVGKPKLYISLGYDF
ncbi:BamA/TamA family outer membrane protein [Emticicia fontis]